MTRGSLILIVSAFGLAVILIGGTAALGWPIEWAIRVGLLALSGFLVYFLVRWHARNFAYECPECCHKFSISTLTDLVSPHYPDKKRLRCPACHKRSWCREISGSAVPAKVESIRQDK